MSAGLHGMTGAIVQHLPALPVVVPFVAGALLLLLSEKRRRTRVAIALASMMVQLLAAAGLLYMTTTAVPTLWPEGIGVYAIGTWTAPFGIVLVVDRLSALMVTLSSVVALSALLYSVARWDKPGQPYHSLLQFLAMGVHGAFLTGDIFNLYVFFEILLAASYGLMLRGLGAKRVKTGLNYIAVNLASSVLFLIGVAIIYGIAGTLNMADLTAKVAALTPGDRSLFDAGAAILGVAFLVKAGSWPLNFWLPRTYSIAIAPVAAAFAIMTKVGIYAVLRVGTLMDREDAAATILGWILFYVGIATLVSGIVGMLESKRLARLVGYSVIVSSGLLLATLGLGIEALTAPVLFYLVTSVLTTATFFMLAGMAERARVTATPIPEPLAPAPRPFFVAYGVEEPDPYGISEEVGTAIPAAMAFLGLVFVCCVLLVSGLPPLPGFVAKFALLSTALAAAGSEAAPVWVLVTLVLLSGLVGIVALSRIGMRLFWSAAMRRVPRLRVLEAAPVAMLVLLCLGLSAMAGPVMAFMEAAARSLHEPETYIRAVLESRAGAEGGER